MPRPMSMVARVTMKGGISSLETKKPTNTPKSIPTTIAASIATGVLMPKSTSRVPATAPQEATTEPTPRSTLPVSTHSSIPTARMTT